MGGWVGRGEVWADGARGKRRGKSPRENKGRKELFSEGVSVGTRAEESGEKKNGV